MPPDLCAAWINLGAPRSGGQVDDIWVAPRWPCTWLFFRGLYGPWPNGYFSRDFEEAWPLRRQLFFLPVWGPFRQADHPYTPLPAYCSRFQILELKILNFELKILNLELRILELELKLSRWSPEIDVQIRPAVSWIRADFRPKPKKLKMIFFESVLKSLWKTHALEPYRLSGDSLDAFFILPYTLLPTSAGTCAERGVWVSPVSPQNIHMARER